MKTIDRLREMATADCACETQDFPASRKDLFALQPLSVEAREFPFAATRAELASPAFFGQFVALRHVRLHEAGEGRTVVAEFGSELSAALAFMVA